jgi:hypothetical protein
VFPMKKVIVDNTSVLDLNTTARKNDKTIDKFSPYMQHMTYFVLTADLAHPIGSFDEAKQMEMVKQEINRTESERITETARSKTESQAIRRPVAAMIESDAIYERMIIVIPYKQSDQVKAIESSFEAINIELLGLSNARYLNTKELTKEDKANRSMDFLGGFELIDKEMRMYIIEGLGGTGKSMNKFYLANEREHTNDRRFKMIYNPDIKYKHRLYQEFNCAIKKIKLRDTLTTIMSEPDIYLRSKVPEDMYDTLQKFAEIRKLDRANLVRDFNLFPIAVNLLTLERKYGDSLTLFDLNGQKPKRKQKKTQGESKSDLESVSQMTKTTKGPLSDSVTTKTQHVVKQEESSEDEVVVRDVTKRKAPTDCRNTQFALSLQMRQSCQS